MLYNSKVSFSDEWAQSVTEDWFVKHESHHGLTEKQLREAWRLMNKVEEPKAPKETKKEK